MMSNKVYVRGHFRRIREKEAVKGYPRDKRKCLNDCRNAKKNSQGQLICTQYFDFVPRPFNCEQDGKFIPR